MIHYRLLNPHYLLQHELMVNGHLGVAIGEVLDLLLLRNNLLIEKVDLLCGNRVIVRLCLLSWSRGLSSDVVERVFAIRFKLGVFKLPGLGNASSETDINRTAIWVPHILSIRRLAILLIILSYFVEVVLVQLSHETGKVAVFEMLRQYRLGKFLALQLVSGRRLRWLA
jgi:hypothetical protein